MNALGLKLFPWLFRVHMPQPRTHEELVAYTAHHNLDKQLTTALNKVVTKGSTQPLVDISHILAPLPRQALQPSGRRRLFLGGNYKCKASRSSMETLAVQLNALAAEFPVDCEVVLFAPTLLIDLCSRLFGPPFVIGAQNVWDASAPLGEHTAVTTAAALKDFGVSWVLLGHSDRRNALGESSALIAEKAKAALQMGLNVNLTFGETKAQRGSGDHLEAIESQLAPVAEALRGELDLWTRVVLAYEPVWAIGEGATPCSPEQAQSVHAHVRSWLAMNATAAVADDMRIAYTGSVSPTNAAGFARMADVDGFVCGRASLVASDFLQVIAARSIRRRCSHQRAVSWAHQLHLRLPISAGCEMS